VDFARFRRHIFVKLTSVASVVKIACFERKLEKGFGGRDDLWTGGRPAADVSGFLSENMVKLRRKILSLLWGLLIRH
jgi:hypothetical protein